MGNNVVEKQKYELTVPTYDLITPTQSPLMHDITASNGWSRQHEDFGQNTRVMNIEEDLVKTIETHRANHIESFDHSPTTTEKRHKNKSKFDVSILKNNKEMKDVTTFNRQAIKPLDLNKQIVSKAISDKKKIISQPKQIANQKTNIRPI